MNKRTLAQMENFLDGIFNTQKADILVIRGKDCELLFMNTLARGRLSSKVRNSENCMEGYCEVFPDLCRQCPHLDHKMTEAPFAFDIKDRRGHTFLATCRSIEWLDGKAATLLFIENVEEERKTQQKLYTLAYMDHLTGVPNRQKLKEDFEAARDDIERHNLCGILAIFDLDNFKTINDTYGHNTGDVLLKRLTAHLQEDPAFAGHLYRLGGDEFVLFYADPHAKYPSQTDLVAHYEQLLHGAFLTYSMPHIEVTCTISMGVSFFPHHGVSFSDLLRRADIALYKAKADGRNKMVLFDESFDTARKFKDLYINVQPILLANSQTYGYELVDGGNDEPDDEALNLTDFDRTMDALGLGDMENNSRYFIAFSTQLLSKTVLHNLPKEKFIIQIHGQDNVSEKQLKMYRELRIAGYSLALTGISSTDVKPTLLGLVEYCKFEPGAVDNYQQKKFISENASKRFIATDVDSPQAFEEAQKRGFKLFEGFFFNQPAVVRKTKNIDPLKLNYYRLLKLASADEGVDFREISTVISSDVALSYKLLRLLNSAAIGLRNPVSSINMAVAYLGENHLKKWIAMLALRGLASDKPLELVRTSLIRAQFGELLALYFKPKRNPQHIFLVGMFSLLHIALEQTPEEMLAEIPVATDIRNSLLTKTGPYSDLLAFFEDYEYANWDEIARFSEEKHISSRLINDSYITAIKWYNNLAEA